MSANGVLNIQFITDKMNHRQYIQILKDTLNGSADKLVLSGRYIFQQDYDQKHTAQNTKLWILYNTRSRYNTNISRYNTDRALVGRFRTSHLETRFYNTSRDNFKAAILK